MATENLVPAYLAEIYNRAIPSPVSDNSPFQGFSAPINDVSTQDTVTAATASRPFLYGSMRYGRLLYQQVMQPTLSGNEITDATRTAAVQGDGAAIPGGVGVWEATTNLCTNGGFETDAGGWSLDSAGGSITRITTDHKFGTACLKVVTGASGGGAYAQPSLAAATKYTLSCWMKGDVGGETVQLRLWDNVTGTQFSSVFTLTTTWTRYTFTATTGAASASWNVAVYHLATSVATWYMDGFQTEQKSIATPYVETNGGTASRSAARVQAPASLLSAAQGWVAMRVKPGYASSSVANGQGDIMRWNGDGNNLFDVNLQNNIAEMYARAGGTSLFVDASASYSANQAITIVAYWTATKIGVSFNGGTFVTGNGPGVPANLLSTFDIGSNATTNGWIDGSVVWFACGTGTLTDADAGTLYNLGDTAPTFSTLSSAAYTTGIIPDVANAAGVPYILAGP